MAKFIKVCLSLLCGFGFADILLFPLVVAAFLVCILSLFMALSRGIDSCWPSKPACDRSRYLDLLRLQSPVIKSKNDMCIYSDQRRCRASQDTQGLVLGTLPMLRPYSTLNSTLDRTLQSFSRPFCRFNWKARRWQKSLVALLLCLSRVFQVASQTGTQGRIPVCIQGSRRWGHCRRPHVLELMQARS